MADATCLRLTPDRMYCPEGSGYLQGNYDFSTQGYTLSGSARTDEFGRGVQMRREQGAIRLGYD